MGLFGPPSYLTVRTLRVRIVWRRRKPRSLSRRQTVVLKWACWELEVRYVRRRGWSPRRLLRVFRTASGDPLCPSRGGVREEEVRWVSAP